MKVNEPLSLEHLTTIFRTSPKDPLRIINREGTSIEFKTSFNFGGMAQYFKTIAAFANNSGGYIIFGVGDKPRRLIGLKDKSLNQFEDLKVEDFTKNLSEYFSPEIKWDHCTFEFKELSFGVIYTYPLRNKPCICKKAYEDKNPKYTLKEGDIYYRYGGRSERIKYSELSAIIDEARRMEEAKWLDFAKRAVRIGVDNACLLDLENGKISEGGGTIVIDEQLLSKIAFIKSGEFVEEKGKPALRLIGDIQGLETGKIIVRETTKKVIRAIEAEDVIKSFLLSQPVEEPQEYIRSICSATSANYPVYYFIKEANINIADAIAVVEKSAARGNARKNLLDRLNGKKIEPGTISERQSEVKRTFYQQWKNAQIPDDIEDVDKCIAALLALSAEEIKSGETYIKQRLYKIYSDYYKNAKSGTASNIRKAICRVDEALNL